MNEIFNKEGANAPKANRLKVFVIAENWETKAINNKYGNTIFPKWTVSSYTSELLIKPGARIAIM